MDNKMIEHIMEMITNINTKKINIDGEEFYIDAFSNYQLSVLAEMITSFVELNQSINDCKRLYYTKINEDAKDPVYAHGFEDACFDIFTSKEVKIPSNSTIAIPTGVAFEIPHKHMLEIKNRSGVSIKGVDGNYARVLLGTVDEGYRDEVKIITHNQENYDIIIPKHTKLAQVEIRRVVHANLVEVDSISKSTSRGLDGFGSTGI